MGFLKTFAATAVLSTLIPNSVALNVDSKTNVAVYYGQGANQDRLSHFCQETSVDIINIGFINVFPEAVGEWPGSNFGNQCDGNVYENTELLSGCHQIWEDIPVCKELGKTVMLSLGGETAYQTIPSDEVAEWFADFLWYSFGPPGQNSSFPRPFRDNQVDGFDFDIEHNGGYGYATMIRRLRSHFANFPDETFYISGAPQCQLPDTQLSDAISNSEFDFIWVQWYNTAGCSAMDFVEGTGLFNFAQWSKVIEHSANPNAKLFVGLPASESAAVDGFYLSPAEVYPLVEIYMNLYPDLFGGIMLWEATASDNNVIDGHNFAQHMKHILHKCDPSPPQTSTIFVTPTPKPTSSTPSSSMVQTSTSSSQAISTQSSSSASLSPSSTSSVHSTVASSSASSTSSASSHVSSSSTPVVSGSSSIKPTVTPSGILSSSGSGTTIQSSTSSSPASHSSSSTGVKPTHTTSETAKTSATSIASSSTSSTSSSAPGTTESESSSTSTVVSSSSASRSPSRTPITRTPVSSSPAATGTHVSSTRRPIATGSSSATTTDSAASSTGTSDSSSNGETVSTGKPSSSGTESSTVSQSTSNGSESTTSTLSTGGSGVTETESSTGVQPTGNGSNSGTAPVVTASPSVTSVATTTKAPTVTTIIVTSYTDICPTGFTTITTTITTTICPEATATAGVTNPPSGPASTTPSIPEGWTTTVKVCDNCAPTPTTVTLTLPNPVKTTAPALETSAVDVVTKTWTTVVTFCPHCSVTGALITKTVPYTPATSTATAIETPATAEAPGAVETPGVIETPGTPSGQADETVPGQFPQPTAGNNHVVVPSHRPSSSWVHGSGAIHSPTQTPTFKVHASTTSTVQNTSPTGNAGGVSPTFNAAGSRSGLMNLFGISIAAVLSLCILI